MASSCSTVEHMHRVAFYRVGTKIIESIWSTPLEPPLLITFLAHPTVIFPASNVRTTTGRVLSHELHQIRRTVFLEIRRRWPFRFKIRFITFFCFSFLLLFCSPIRFNQYRIPFVFVFCTVGRLSRVAIVTSRSFKCNGESRHAVVTRESRKTAARERHQAEFVCARFLVYICYVSSVLFLLACCGLGIRSLSRLRAYACPALPMRLRVSLLQV